MRAEPVPVTLIGGYLGAGKTTLVNYLLRSAGGRRLAVLVNEFGALPIDRDLIEGQDGDIISISGGCICCSFGNDLIAAVMRLTEREDAVDNILVETSGVALPGVIVQSLSLIPGLRVDCTVILADAETLESRSRDRYVGETVRNQLAAADIILLNKTDLVSEGLASRTTEWLARTAPGVRVLAVRHARVPIEMIVGENPTGRGKRAPPVMVAHEAAAYAAQTFEIAVAVDPELLARLLTDDGLGLLRAKGFVRQRDDTFCAVQVVGRRSAIDAAPAGVEGPGRLACIGVAALMDRAKILNAIALAGMSATRAPLDG